MARVDAEGCKGLMPDQDVGSMEGLKGAPHPSQEVKRSEMKRKGEEMGDDMPNPKAPRHIQRAVGEQGPGPDSFGTPACWPGQGAKAEDGRVDAPPASLADGLQPVRPGEADGSDEAENGVEAGAAGGEEYDSDAECSSEGSSEDNNPGHCDACHNKDSEACKDPILICDGRRCKVHNHLACASPPLAGVPPGRWLCSNCEYKHMRHGCRAACQVKEILVCEGRGRQHHGRVREAYEPVQQADAVTAVKRTRSGPADGPLAEASALATHENGRGWSPEGAGIRQPGPPSGGQPVKVTEDEQAAQACSSGSGCDAGVFVDDGDLTPVMLEGRYTGKTAPRLDMWGQIVDPDGTPEEAALGRSTGGRRRMLEELRGKGVVRAGARPGGEEAEGTVEQYLVHWHGEPHIHDSWESREWLQANAPKKLRAFCNRCDKAPRLRPSHDPQRVAGERRLQPPQRPGRGMGRGTGFCAGVGEQAWVKWKGVGYHKCTWLSATLPAFPPHVRAALGKARADAKTDARRRKKLLKEKGRGLEVPELPAALEISEQPPWLEGANVRLWPIQVGAVRWLLARWRQGRNARLAADGGLGKSVIALTFLQLLYRARCCLLPSLIVVPARSIRRWDAELSAWAPGLYHVTFTGGVEVRDQIKRHELNEALGPLGLAHVILTTPQTAEEEASYLRSCKFGALLAHRDALRGPRGFQSLSDVQAHFRLLLTSPRKQPEGTDAALEDTQFLRAHEQHADLQGPAGSVAAEASNGGPMGSLRAKLEAMTFTCRSQDAAAPVKHGTVLVPAASAPLQADLYRSVLLGNAALLRSGDGTSTDGVSLRDVMFHLLKCCDYPDLVTRVPLTASPAVGQLASMTAASGKLRVLDAMLQAFRERGGCIMLLCRKKASIRMLEDYLRLRMPEASSAAARWWTLGKVGVEERKKLLQQLAEAQASCKLLLTSPDTCSLGMDLSCVDTAVVFDFDCRSNPEQDVEAVARAVPRNHDKPVLIYRLYLSHTVEEGILSLAYPREVTAADEAGSTVAGGSLVGADAVVLRSVLATGHGRFLADVLPGHFKRQGPMQGSPGASVGKGRQDADEVEEVDGRVAGPPAGPGLQGPPHEKDASQQEEDRLQQSKDPSQQEKGPSQPLTKAGSSKQRSVRTAKGHWLETLATARAELARHLKAGGTSALVTRMDPPAWGTEFIAAGPNGTEGREDGGEKGLVLARAQATDAQSQGLDAGSTLGGLTGGAAGGGGGGRWFPPTSAPRGPFQELLMKQMVRAICAPTQSAASGGGPGPGPRRGGRGATRRSASPLSHHPLQPGQHLLRAGAPASGYAGPSSSVAARQRAAHSAPVADQVCAVEGPPPPPAPWVLGPTREAATGPAGTEARAGIEMPAVAEETKVGGVVAALAAARAPASSAEVASEGGGTAGARASGQRRRQDNSTGTAPCQPAGLSDQLMVMAEPDACAAISGDTEEVHAESPTLLVSSVAEHTRGEGAINGSPERSGPLLKQSRPGTLEGENSMEEDSPAKPSRGSENVSYSSHGLSPLRRRASPSLSSSSSGRGSGNAPSSGNQGDSKQAAEAAIEPQVPTRSSEDVVWVSSSFKTRHQAQNGHAVEETAGEGAAPPHDLPPARPAEPNVAEGSAESPGGRPGNRRKERAVTREADKQKDRDATALHQGGDGRGDAKAPSSPSSQSRRSVLGKAHPQDGNKAAGRQESGPMPDDRVGLPKGASVPGRGHAREHNGDKRLLMEYQGEALRTVVREEDRAVRKLRAASGGALQRNLASGGSAAEEEKRIEARMAALRKAYRQRRDELQESQREQRNRITALLRGLGTKGSDDRAAEAEIGQILEEGRAAARQRPLVEAPQPVPAPRARAPLQGTAAATGGTRPDPLLQAAGGALQEQEAAAAPQGNGHRGSVSCEVGRVAPIGQAGTAPPVQNGECKEAANVAPRGAAPHDAAASAGGQAAGTGPSLAGRQGPRVLRIRASGLLLSSLEAPAPPPRMDGPEAAEAAQQVPQQSRVRDAGGAEGEQAAAPTASQTTAQAGGSVAARVDNNGAQEGPSGNGASRGCTPAAETSPSLARGNGARQTTPHRAHLLARLAEATGSLGAVAPGALREFAATTWAPTATAAPRPRIPSSESPGGLARQAVQPPLPVASQAFPPHTEPAQPVGIAAASGLAPHQRGPALAPADLAPPPPRLHLPSGTPAPPTPPAPSSSRPAEAPPSHGTAPDPGAPVADRAAAGNGPGSRAGAPSAAPVGAPLRQEPQGGRPQWTALLEATTGTPGGAEVRHRLPRLTQALLSRYPHDPLLAEFELARQAAANVKSAAQAELASEKQALQEALAKLNEEFKRKEAAISERANSELQQLGEMMRLLTEQARIARALQLRDQLPVTQMQLGARPPQQGAPVQPTRPADPPLPLHPSPRPSLWEPRSSAGSPAFQQGPTFRPTSFGEQLVQERSRQQQQHQQQRQQGRGSSVPPSSASFQQQAYIGLRPPGPSLASSLTSQAPAPGTIPATTQAQAPVTWPGSSLGGAPFIPLAPARVGQQAAAPMRQVAPTYAAASSLAAAPMNATSLPQPQPMPALGAAGVSLYHGAPYTVTWQTEPLVATVPTVAPGPSSSPAFLPTSFDAGPPVSQDQRQVLQHPNVAPTTDSAQACLPAQMGRLEALVDSGPASLLPGFGGPWGGLTGSAPHAPG